MNYSNAFASAALIAVAAFSSASAAIPSAEPYHNSVVSAGWWEEHGDAQAIKDRYWHLSPDERYHYNQIEAQIQQLQYRQQRMLGIDRGNRPPPGYGR